MYTYVNNIVDVVVEKWPAVLRNTDADSIHRRRLVIQVSLCNILLVFAA